VPEARLEDSGSGLAPAGDGWFVLNVRDAEWWTSETLGSGCGFESQKVWFRQVGINVHVLEPGEPNGLYHSENQQKAFLVLSGSAGWSSRVRSDSSGRGTSSTVPPGPSTSSWAPAPGRARS
jgi:uncharacterized cupin superfamily protein